MFGRTSADEEGERLNAGPEVPLSFDGAAELLRAWCEGLRPDPDLTVSAWADTHRIERLPVSISMQKGQG